MTGLAVPIPYNWAVGDTGNAALLNAQVRDGLTFELNPPAFSVAQTSGQNTTTAVVATLTWPTPTEDTYGAYDVAHPTRCTPQVAGQYDALATVGLTANSTGNRAVIIAKNGTTIYQCNLPTVATPDISVLQCTAFLVAMNGTTDYLEVQYLQRSGITLATVAATTQFDVEFRRGL